MRPFLLLLAIFLSFLRCPHSQTVKWVVAQADQNFKNYQACDSGWSPRLRMEPTADEAATAVKATINHASWFCDNRRPVVGTGAIARFAKWELRCLPNFANYSRLRCSSTAIPTTAISPTSSGRPRLRIFVLAGRRFCVGCEVFLLVSVVLLRSCD